MAVRSSEICVASDCKALRKESGTSCERWETMGASNSTKSLRRSRAWLLPELGWYCSMVKAAGSLGF